MPDHDLKMKIDHIGIATEHLEDGLAIWRDALGLTVQQTEEVAEQRVRVAMLPIGDTRVELLEPTTPDSAVGKFLAKRGPGIHHIAVKVQDINASLAELKRKGARLIDETSAFPLQFGQGCVDVLNLHSYMMNSGAAFCQKLPNS